MLQVELGPLKLANPVMTASGTFGGIFDRVIDINRLGALVLKTITAEPRKGNPPPRIAETPSGALNSIGLENKGVDKFIAEELPQLESLRTRLIVNIAGKSVEEFGMLARKLAPCKRIDALELNLSCPNVAGGLDFATNPDVTRKSVRAVKEGCSFPISLPQNPGADCRSKRKS
jgi:dihydroorotate dehydrogenase (NAD+) catalytic subunit